MIKSTAILVAAVAVAVSSAWDQALAFHPFDQPTGYQMPKWIEQRGKPPSRAAQPATAIKQKANTQNPALLGAEDDEPAPQNHKPQAVKFPKQLDGGPQPAISPSSPPTVRFSNSYGAGTVVIDTAGKSLFYVLSSTTAYKYPISVGRVGFTWTGTEKISRVASWPDWRPPAEMRERQPGLPEVMTGGIRNPLGAKALYLGNSLYRIHGTNDVKTIGQAASSGCFRMLNGHVVHLAGLAGVGTTVKVLNKLPSNVVSASGKGGNG